MPKYENEINYRTSFPPSPSNDFSFLFFFFFLFGFFLLLIASYYHFTKRRITLIEETLFAHANRQQVG